MGTINNVNIQVSLTEINRVNTTITALYNRLESLSEINNTYSESAKKASKDTKKLSESFAAIRKAAKKAFDAIKEAGKELWVSIESSFDYVEASNYFEAVLGQMAGNAELSSFQEMGYASADAYYDSFAQRAKVLTAKMSGFTVGENGLLQAAGGMSLGLDPSQIMNYQAVFGQISSSMGMSGETALKLSQALTEIGADLASVKNMDFDKVWEDMASGLAGTSSALDKYGANIRDASLQQKLAELGINTNIEALDQTDKALLRAVVLLDSTRHAWGNLADSIDQPTNQLRLIQSNFENLSRMIGSLFLPTVSTVLPYVNAFAIALQRLLSWLGSLAGIDISSISAMAEGADLSGILDQADKLEDGLSGAKKEADKLNKSVRQFDELKVISAQDAPDAPAIAEGPESTDDTGLLDAAFNNTLSEYQKEWDGAFVGIENRAQEIADSFEKAFEPVKKLVQDLSIGDFFQAGKDTSAIVMGITDFIADAIDSVDWHGIGQKIGDYLAGIDWFAAFKSVGNLVWQALKAAFELYFGVFSSAPLETAVISLAAMPGHLKAVTASAFVTGFKNLADKVKLVSTSFMGNIDNTKLLADQYPKLGKKVDIAKDSFWALKTGIADKNFGTGLNLALENIRNHLTGLQKAGITAIAGLGEFTVISKTFEGLTLGTENLLGGIFKIGGVSIIAAGAMYTALGPAGLAIAAITGVVAAIEGINDAFDEIRAKEIGESIKNVMSNPGGVPISELSSGISDALANAASGFQELNNASDEVTAVNKNIKSVADEIGKIKRAMDLGVLSVEEGKEKLDNLFGQLVDLTSQKMSVLTTYLLGLYGEGGALSYAYDETQYGVEQVTDAVIRTEYATTDAAQAILEQMKEVDFGSSEWNSLYQQLLKVSSEMKDFEKAAFIFSDKMNSIVIDWEDLIKQDGSLNTKYLETLLGNVSKLLEKYEDALDEAEINTKLYWQEMLIKAVTPEDKELFQQLLNDVPIQFGKMRIDAEGQVTQFTNLLQVDFVDRTAEIISDADSQWTGALHQGKKGNYIKKEVDKFYEEFGKLQSEIKESFSDLKGTGTAQAKEAMDSIYGELFSVDYSGRFWMDLLNPDYLLNENWESVIGMASSSLKEAAGIEGRVMSDAFYEQMKEEIPSWAAYSEKGLKDEIEKRLDEVIKTGNKMADAFDIGFRERVGISSPSKIFAENGMYVVLGFNQGISDNTSKTISTITRYANCITETFSLIIQQFVQVGIQAMQGLIDGLSFMEKPLFAKVENIAGDIAGTIKTILEIHSPSRVMFKLGDYTMQGFQNGLENLYQPILSSAKDFGYELYVAPALSLSDIYGNYGDDISEYLLQKNVLEYPQVGDGQTNTKTNAILTELLAELRKGHIIELDGGVVAGRTRRIANAYTRSQGEPYFEI